MSKWTVYKFRELDELNTFTSGGVPGADVSYFANALKIGKGGAQDPPVLAGTTLTTIAPGPAGSVTFVAGVDPNGRLSYQEIKAQIEAAIAGLTVKQFEGKLYLVETTVTNGVTVAAGSGGGFAQVIGTVDMNTLAYGAGGTVDGLTVILKHNAGANHTCTFVAPVNRADVVTQLNAVFVAQGITASIDGNNHLVFTASDQGAAASITVGAGTANAALGLGAGAHTGAATNTANAPLGFDTSANTVGKVYGSPYGDTPTPPYVGMTYSTNDNMHVVWVYS